jgi:hypothetical protein
MTQIVGVTHPIQKKHMDRFFAQGKDVFFKPATVYRHLKPEMKFIFYQSREDTGFVGEATIENIEMFDSLQQLVGRYGERIYLTMPELEDYTKMQSKWKKRRRVRTETRVRQWMAIELKDVLKYETPIKPRRPVPVSGQYLRM